MTNQQCIQSMDKEKLIAFLAMWSPEKAANYNISRWLDSEDPTLIPQNIRVQAEGRG